MECDEWLGRRSLVSGSCIVCGQSWSVSEIPELFLVNLLTPSMACTELDMLQDVRVLQVSSRPTSILLHLYWGLKDTADQAAFCKDTATDLQVCFNNLLAELLFICKHTKWLSGPAFGNVPHTHSLGQLYPTLLPSVSPLILLFVFLPLCFPLYGVGC